MKVKIERGSPARNYQLFVKIDGEMVECGYIRVEDDGQAHAEVHDAFVEVAGAKTGYELKKAAG